MQKPTYNGGYVEDFGPLVLSPLAANYALVYLDSRYNDIGCDKTDFAFIYIDEQGNEQRYTGGYDIGYEHKSLLEHMRTFGDDEQAAEMANAFEKCLLESKGFDNITPFPRGDNDFPSGGREVAENTPAPEKDLAYFEHLDELELTEEELKEVNIMLDSSATRTDIMGFAKRAYAFVKEAMPEYLPDNLSDSECIDNFAKSIYEGNKDSVCQPLEKIARIGTSEQREQARNLIDAYKAKSGEWAIEDNKSKSLQPHVSER